MAKQYLDKDGLLYFWQKIKAIFAKKDEAIKTITRSGTTFTATRADGTTFTFTQQDNNTWNANAVGVAGYVAAPSSTTANKVWKTDGDGVPAWRDDANTTYSDATTSASGLMSSSDKTKLNGIATGAEVNQNAFSNVKVGSTTIAADGKTDTLELVAGTNVTLTPDATNDTVTIAATGAVTSVAGKTGAVTLSKSDVGLGNVDNTADANKNVASAAKLTTAKSIDGLKFDGSAAVTRYGLCQTISSNPDKEVNLSGTSTFELVMGACVYIKFYNSNTAAVGDLTLNVNNTGAKAIKRFDTTDLPTPGTISAGKVIPLVYDGTNWLWLGDVDTNTFYDNVTLGQGYATCSTAGNTAAKTASLSGYQLITGGVVVVKFDNAVPAESTLNVNSKGSKYIYYKGAKITSNVISAGDVASFIYDGVYYRLIAIDRWGTDIANKVDKETGKGLSNLQSVGLGSIQSGPDVITFTTYGSEPNYKALASSSRGAANGVASLDSSGKVPSSQLPSYVDDVIEAYARSGQTALSSTWLATGSASGTVITPETGKIYVLMADSGDYAANTQFRWSGSAYVKLADGGVSSITNAEIDTIVAA